jgi:hypothetical protein
MIVSQQLVQKVNGIVADEPLVVCIDERMPRLFRIPAQYIVVLGIELNVVLVKIVEQVFCSQDLRNLDELVRVAVAMEKWFPSKDHRCKHGAQRPHVERVVILLKIYEKLWPFEIARRDAHIILGTGVVELGEAPIDQPQLLCVSKALETSVSSLTFRFS